MLTRLSQDVEDSVEQLMFATKSTDVKLHSALNEFMLLSNVQFVENVCRAVCYRM